MTKKFLNPIEEIYRGVPVRKYETLKIRCTIAQKKKAIDARLDLGLTTEQAIAQGIIMCDLCNGMEIKIQKSLYAKST